MKHHTDCLSCFFVVSPQEGCEPPIDPQPNHTSQRVKTGVGHEVLGEPAVKPSPTV